MLVGSNYQQHHVGLGKVLSLLPGPHVVEVEYFFLNFGFLVHLSNGSNLDSGSGLGLFHRHFRLPVPLPFFFELAVWIALALQLFSEV